MRGRSAPPLKRIAAISVVGALVASASVLHAAAPASSRPEPPPSISVRWMPLPTDTNQFAVAVSGLGAEAFQRLRSANWTAPQWQRLLAVYADQGDLIADIGLPPMLGTYRVEPTAVWFEPGFPLDPVIQYRAVFRWENLPSASGPRGKPITAVFQLPPRRSLPTTVVSQVYPSADVLPENLLKFYVHFSAPMSGGHIYGHIHLRDESGREIELPFLEIDEELWNPEMTRLTLFIDPGRIKRGVRPLEEIGPSLETGRGYTLVLDREWKDAAGLPLKQPFQKKFRVGPPDREPPDPARWKVEAPTSTTRRPLTVTFPDPMDHALAGRMIRVARESGELIDGTTSLTEQERRWSFVPASPWPRGNCKLIIQTTIEDLAGNNIGKAFEVDLFEGVQRRVTNATVKLPFEVR